MALHKEPDTTTPFAPCSCPCSQRCQHWTLIELIGREQGAKGCRGIWLLMQGPEGPGRSGPKAPVSKLSWRCCSLLSHLGGGPYADSFSVVALLTIISSLLIASGARQAPRPNSWTWVGTKEVRRIWFLMQRSKGPGSLGPKAPCQILPLFTVRYKYGEF